MQTFSDTVVVSGNRPTGRCRANGTSIWVQRTYSTDDRRWTFTEYDGWLIANETTTTSPEVADYLTKMFDART